MYLKLKASKSSPHCRQLPLKAHIKSDHFESLLTAYSLALPLSNHQHEWHATSSVTLPSISLVFRSSVDRATPPGQSCSRVLCVLAVWLCIKPARQRRYRDPLLLSKPHLLILHLAEHKSYGEGPTL